MTTSEGTMEPNYSKYEPFNYLVEAHDEWYKSFTVLAGFIWEEDASKFCKSLAGTRWEEPRIVYL